MYKENYIINFKINYVDYLIYTIINIAHELHVFRQNSDVGTYIIIISKYVDKLLLHTEKYFKYSKTSDFR